MTEPQYWVRRQDRIHGPFSLGQITGGVQSGKLTLHDELASSNQGPWAPIATVASKLKASAPSSPGRIDAIPAPSPEPVTPPAQVTRTECVLRIRRNTGYYVGRLTKIDVLLDTELIAKLGPNETHQTSVTPGRHVVQVKGGGAFTGAKHIILASPSSEIEVVVSYGAFGGLKIEEFFSGESDSTVHDGQPGEPAFIFEGLQDWLEVYSDYLTITPKGALGLLNKGLKGTKDIPYASITAVQLREATSFLNGFIQFSILGGNESRGGLRSAHQDENTVMFARAAENTKVKKIKEYVDLATRRLREPKPVAKAADGIACELQRLVTLKEQGVLTDEEFQQAKRKLIS